MPLRHHGWLILDKPAGISSRQAVNRATRWFPRGTRIGHTGTLDPFATGVLVLAIGAATRLAEYVQKTRKTYRARFHLGARSETDDIEGPIEAIADAPVPDLPTLNMVCSEFVGKIDQAPPTFSAVKIGGKRAYQLAREGAAVELKSRRIVVDRIDILSYQYPHLDLEIRCSEGTYVRSLARDIGHRLKCGAYAETLERLCVGSFGIENALRLDANAETAVSRLLPPAAAVSHLFPVRLTATWIDQLRQGKRVPAKGLVPQAAWEINRQIAVLDGEILAAIAEYDPVHEQLKPMKVFKY